VAKLISTDHDFQSVNRPINVPASTANGQVVVHEQLLSAIEGVKPKADAKVRTATNINLAAPGAVLDGETMAASDRFVADGQTNAAENGLYVFTGPGTPATRSTDANTATSLSQAVVTVTSGTSAGTTWRQSASNITLGTTPIDWIPYGSGVVAATEATSGVLPIATQVKTDAGLDDNSTVTPKKLRNASFLSATKEFLLGDGTANSFTLTHNFNTKKVGVVVYEATGLEREIDVEVNRNAGLDAIVIKMNPVPALNSIAAYVTRFGMI
jgi:hypothetical protein